MMDSPDQGGPDQGGHRVSQVDIRGDRIQVMRGGSGPTLLVLHGAGGADAWQPWMTKLARDHQVIVPQHPGFGGAEPPEWLDNIADLASFYLDFLETEQLRDVHLVGFSLGGWIAAELATRNTSRLASLTLVAAAGIRVPGVPQIDIFATSEEQSLRDLYYDQTLAEAALARVLVPETEDARLYNRVTAAKLLWQPRLHDPHLRKRLHRIDVPTLLIWGEHDRVFPPAYGRAWQELVPGAQLLVLPACGHLPQAEAPDAMASAINQFVAGRRIAA
jgi:pimeloyl-ACP methyl ester carboxylesterase